MEPKAPKPFQRLRVLLVCTTVILIVTAAYFDFFSATVNIYAIVGKDACFLLAYACPIIYFMITKDKRQRFWAVFGVFWIIIICLRTKDEIRDYNHTLCHTQFGVPFNQSRRERGIPTIPQDWQMELKSDTEIVWKGKNKAIGHISKCVFIDSTCTDTFEIDYYNLKPLRGVSRSLSIAEEAYEQPLDTYICMYDFGDNHRQINKMEADSILIAEKIQKDY